MTFSLPRRSRALTLLLVGTAFLPSVQAQSLGPPPVPQENPITEPKRLLGKILFWDEQLSSDNTVACGTCHIPAAGGSDPRLDLTSRHPGLDGVYGNEDDRFASAGVPSADAGGSLREDPLFGFERQVTGRRAPSMIGAAFFDELFWDGRATSTFLDPETGAVSIPSGGALESQAVGPILSMVEMADEGRTWDDVRTKLEGARPLALATNLNPDIDAAITASPTYPSLFAAAFGDPAITAERIGFALATYQRTLHPDQTPYDLFQSGQSNALTGQQQSGLSSFLQSSNRCADCHPPPFFSDGSYRNLGLRDIAEDSGRQAITGLFSDRGKFKVPSLRNVGLRTRFFHNGDPTFSSMFLSVFFYNQGGGFFLDNKDPLLGSIFLSPTEAGNITAFLQDGLTDPRVLNEVPPFDRPTLRSELGPVATLSGRAAPGSGGFRPRMLANAPALSGSADFRVGVHQGLGGAPAFLTMRQTAPGTGLGTPATGGVLGAPAPTAIVYRTILDGIGDGAGHATWRESIPGDPALIGTDLYFRWMVADPAARTGRASSQWARLIIQ